MLKDRLKPRGMLTAVSITLAAAWLAGCVTAQPVPSSPDTVISDISPDEVRHSDAIGAVVRWGGTIASINNTADGSTLLEIVSRPLESIGRPTHNDQSAGRFIAESSEFLDPEIVKVGRDITIVGTVISMRDGKIGEANYRFPVVAVDSYRYWKKQTGPPPGHFPHWNSYPLHGYDPFWDGWLFPPYRYPAPYHSGVSGSLNFILR